jgi:hypothetical protein
MVFSLVIGMISLTTIYLIRRDLKRDARIKKIDNALKTYLENGKEKTKKPKAG